MLHAAAAVGLDVFVKILFAVVIGEFFARLEVLEFFIGGHGKQYSAERGVGN